MDPDDLTKDDLVRYCEKLQRKMNKYEKRLSGNIQ